MYVLPLYDLYLQAAAFTQAKHNPYLQVAVYFSLYYIGKKTQTRNSENLRKSLKQC